MSDSGSSIAAIGLTLAVLATGPLGLAVAQPPAVQSGEVVPRDVREIYERGLQFLAASQSRDGTWDGGEPGPAMTQGLENAARADGSWASGGKRGTRSSSANSRTPSSLTAASGAGSTRRSPRRCRCSRWR